MFTRSSVVDLDVWTCSDGRRKQRHPPPPPRPWEPEGVGGVPLADKEGVACLMEELIGCEAEWAIWPPPLCLDPGVPW